MYYYSKTEIGERIRREREQFGVSREKFCEKISLSPQFLSEIELGKKGPSSETILKICDGLKVSTDYILRGQENTPYVSRITNMLSELDEEHVALAEDLLKTFIKAIPPK